MLTKRGSYYEYSTGEKVKIYFTSKRTGNMSYINNENINDKVLNNRINFSNEIKQPIEDFVFIQQCHSENICEVDNSNKGQGVYNHLDGIKNVDGLYTFEKNIVLCTYHADCTPVYIYSLEDSFISVIHAGWKGTMKSIVKKAIFFYTQKLNIKKENIKIVIGPSISEENFEVEKDVINLLKKIDYIDYEKCYKKIDSKKYKVDIKKINELQCLSEGILSDNIFISDMDTYDNDDFYSFRKNKTTERMIACIVQE